jgi:hypothetical protein
MNQRFALCAFLLAVTVPFALLTPAVAQIQKVSTDTLHNTDSDHKTEVEPDIFAWGNTIVSTFHVARVPGTIGWGSGDIGFSTSTDGGKTWTSGILPGLTKNYKGEIRNTVGRQTLQSLTTPSTDNG